MRTEGSSAVTGRLVTAIGVATVVIVTAVHVGLALPGLLGTLADQRAPAHQIVGYGVLSVLLVCCGAFLARGRPIPGPVVLAGVLVTLGVGALTTAGLTGAQFMSAAHWSFLEIGWFGVLLLYRDLRRVLAFFAGYLLLTAGQLLLAGVPSQQAAAGMATVAVAVCGLQLAYGAVATLLCDCARRAGQAADEQARIDAARAVAVELHADRQHRYTGLTTTVVPLLTGLADDHLDPRDEGVRQQCAVEAARMRRLFAESDSVDDQLVHELRAGIDVAERRGVVVSLSVRGTPAALPVELRRALIDPGLAAVAAARRSARATVVHTAGEVRLSVVTDEPAAPISPSTHPGVRTETLARDGQLWVTARAAMPARIGDGVPG